VTKNFSRGRGLDAAAHGREAPGFSPGRFTEILRGHLNQDQDRLTALFEAGTRLREQDGWAWYVFVQSYATNGGVRTWDAFLDDGGAELIRWDALFGDLPDDVDAAAARLEALSRRFLAPRRFHAVGGPDVVARTWNGHRQPATLLGWLKTFPMIGDKYARNMCMDVSHPLILDHIALDHRVNELCDRVEGAPRSVPYKGREAWLRGVATELGVSCWHLDRLLFGRFDDLKTVLA
jgi:hypothetical protein